MKRLEPEPHRRKPARDRSGDRAEEATPPACRELAAKLREELAAIDSAIAALERYRKLRRRIGRMLAQLRAGQNDLRRINGGGRA